MIGKVTIGNVEVGMLASVASLVDYEDVFRTDFLQENEQSYVNKMIYARIGYIMAMAYKEAQGEPCEMSKAGYREWLKGFASMDLLLSLNDIATLWAESQKTTATPKKKES